MSGGTYSRVVLINLQHVDDTKEEDIDYSEIPELDDAFFENAVWMPNGFDLALLPPRR